MDNIDKKLLRLLHADARMTVKAISQMVHLSQPSVSERIRRLQEKGIIERFTVTVNPRRVGFPITAIVRISPLPGELMRVEKLITEIEEITQCDKVTGEEAFICRLHLRGIEELDQCLSTISDYATTNTSIVKTIPVSERLLPLTNV